MKTDKKYPKLSSEENLKAENDLLKMKLTAEFGMMRSDTSSLDNELENQWLKYIYEFEKSYADSKQVKIYDYLGRPDFKPIDTLKKAEITTELNKVLEIMEKNFIQLDTVCEYDDNIIYKFITEELFLEEIDDIKVEDLISCYSYEKFHPNHEYDLNFQTEDFFKSLFEDVWDEFDKFKLKETIVYNNKIFDRDEFTIIHTFQDENMPFKLKNVFYKNR